ncbi:hypothetical protein D3C71_1302660 [compost metagenome]
MTTGIGTVTALTTKIVVAAAVDLNADITADLEAGLGTRNVEIACSERVADANIFQRLRFGSDDCVCSLGDGDACKRRGRCDEKARDFHLGFPGQL